jgi:hypothetical protein
MRIILKIRSLFATFLAVAIIISSCKKNDYQRTLNVQQNVNLGNASVALDWYKLQLRLLLERNSTLNGAFFGYLGIGLYESVQPGIKNARSLSSVLYQMPQMTQKEDNEGYNWEISANAAMAALLKSFNVGLTTANLATIDSLENAYYKKLQPGSGTVFERSKAFGQSIAAAVHAWSLTDNFNPSNAGYVYPVFDGSWVPTPPAFANPPVFPFLSTARPLCAFNLNAIADAPPFGYSTDLSSDFYKMVKEVYDVSQTLTQEQKDIALFWVDQGNNSGYTPPGHDFSLLIQALESTGANLATTAEVLAKAGIAERDATIVCFATKYTYNRIRPVSFIQSFIDNTWLPFIVTPPHPEYPAAHAFITGTVMKAAEKVLGHVSVTDHTYDFKGWNARSYNSLFDAARDAGISRLYGGIHYRPSIELGLQLGEELGTKIGELDLRD